jgi:hypothetical protein
MPRRSALVAAAALTLGLLTPAVPAMAKSDHHGSSVSAARSHGQQGRAHGKGHLKFVLAGSLASVDTTAGTVSFQVHGGRDKTLRGTVVTVTVAPDAVVERNDAVATLADLVVGDHVVVKGSKATGSMVASRVIAEGLDLPPVVTPPAAG